MVWPAPNQNPIVESNVTSRSSSSSSSSLSLFEPQPRQSIDRLHRIASPLPLRASSNSPASQQDWHHHRQQQRQHLDLVPYDSPRQNISAASQSTSSLPSTAPPPGFTTMPGSFYSDPDSRSSSPSSDEEDLFRLAHDTLPSLQSANPRSYRLPPPSSQDTPHISPFQPIPSAQPRFSYPSSSASPPPFANMSFSTQAASSLPSPPSSQHERPTSPLSVADSLPTLRQGDTRQHSSPPMSPIRRPQIRGRGGYTRDSEETDAQALNAVVDGIGRMQVNMNLDQAGRWRIARRNDSPR